jgi:hypothetical protein
LWNISLGALITLFFFLEQRVWSWNRLTKKRRAEQSQTPGLESNNQSVFNPSIAIMTKICTLMVHYKFSTHNDKHLNQRKIWWSDTNPGNIFCFLK